MNSKTLKLGMVGIVLTIVAYWYWSPLLVIRQMQSAARAGDSDTFSAHVDYPKLRESMKAQLTASLTQRMGSKSAPDGDVGRAGAALGAILGAVVIDKMVDAFVRPAVVMRAMQEGKMMPKKVEDSASAPQASTEPSEKLTCHSEREGFDKYIAYPGKPGDVEDRRVGLVLERNGFATWKLTEVRLPALR